MDDFDYATTDGQTLKTVFTGLTDDEAKDAIQQIAGGDHLGANQSAAPIAYAFQTAMMGGSRAMAQAQNHKPQAIQYLQQVQRLISHFGRGL